MTARIPISSACEYESEIRALSTDINDIKDTLRDLKDLLQSNAVLREKVDKLEHEVREDRNVIHTLELKIAASSWITRIAWALLPASVLTYFGLSSN